MEDENIELLLTILSNALKENDFGNDTQKIIFLCNSLKKIQKAIPAIDELEELKNIEIDLEIKHEVFYEIGIYFDPLYVKIKNTIHKEEVKKLREENRRKRGIE